MLASVHFTSCLGEIYGRPKKFPRGPLSPQMMSCDSNKSEKPKAESSVEKDSTSKPKPMPLRNPSGQEVVQNSMGSLAPTNGFPAVMTESRGTSAICSSHNWSAGLLSFPLYV